MSLHKVATWLHEINRLERKGRQRAAMAQVARLNEVLQDENLEAMWNQDLAQWEIIDTLFVEAIYG